MTEHLNTRKIYENAAISNANDKNFQEAIKLLLECNKLMESSDTHIKIGICNLNLGKSLEATDNFKNALQIQESWVAYFLLGKSYLKRHDSKAIMALRHSCNF